MAIKSKFLKPENDADLNAVDYWNLHRTWAEVFEGVKGVELIDEKTVKDAKTGKEICKVKGDLMYVMVENSLMLPPDKQFTKFMLLSRLKFKSNHRAAMTYVENAFLNAHVPYIRVGVDYFKVIDKTDRYGINRRTIKGWKKEEIKQDHGQSLMKHISLFDDFCIVPDNKSHSQVVNNCYNLYNKFSHTPAEYDVTLDDVPVSHNLIQHIFGEQIGMAYQYLQAMYLHPQQALPILCLVSKERQTGKTTFLNWMNMVFGDNFIQINPEDLSGQFNSHYVTKNIIAIDETVVDKSHAVEKLKSLATAKTVSVNPKWVQSYSVPFYGKIILATNKERDFMRIDDAEIRFWVRKVPSISHINTAIETQLMNEIPALLRYLDQLPALDFSRSRMLFTAEQLENDSLKSVKTESKSWLYKELFHYFEEYFNTHTDKKEVKVAPIDVKKMWFDHNNGVNIGYISRVFTEEMGLKPGKNQRYHPINGNEYDTKSGTPYTLERDRFTTQKIEVVESEEIPF